MTDGAAHPTARAGPGKRAAVIISNFGTSMVYNGAMRSLRTAAAAVRPDTVWGLDDDREAAEARRSA